MDPLLVKIESGDGYQRLIGGPPQTAGIKSGRVSLKPGESVGKHNTETKEEVIVVLEGEGEVSFTGKNPLKVSKNNLVYVPPQTEHNVLNTGDTSLKYVYIVSGARESK